MKSKRSNVLVGVAVTCLLIFAALTLSGTKSKPAPPTKALASIDIKVAATVPTPPQAVPTPAAPAQRTPDELLFYAVRNNDLLRIEELVKSGAKVTASDEKGWTPLHVAALKGNRAAADYLIAHGADVDAADEDGWTPLHVAAMQGKDPVVDLLVSARAKVNVGDNDGWTPLHLAAKKNATWIVQRLIDAGADIDAEDSEGCTPLTYAVRAGASDAAAILRKSGATLKSGSNTSATPSDPSP